MKSLQVVTSDGFFGNAESWRRSGDFLGIDDDPIYGEFGRAYYPAVFEDRRRDTSFAVTDAERPQAIVQCTRGDDELDYYGAPVRLFLRAGLGVKDAEQATAAAFAQLDNLAGEGRSRRVMIRDDGSLGALSSVGKHCLNRRAAASLRLTGLCALDQDEAGMRRGLRKSFQSLINWGRRNLKLVSVDAANPDRALFKTYRDFHAAVAGRVTRSEQSWEAMFDWIISGKGKLVLGFLESGELVTGTMVVDGTTRSYYASGVYDRNRFDRPLGHWPLWVSMLYSAERGKKIFELGDLPLAGGGSDKEIAVGYFKRGFATSIATWIAWSWTTAEARQGAA
jgi:hypothetical protein